MSARLRDGKVVGTSRDGPPVGLCHFDASGSWHFAKDLSPVGVAASVIHTSSLGGPSRRSTRSQLGRRRLRPSGAAGRGSPGELSSGARARLAVSGCQPPNRYRFPALTGHWRRCPPPSRGPRPPARQAATAQPRPDGMSGRGAPSESLASERAQPQGWAACDRRSRSMGPGAQCGYRREDPRSPSRDIRRRQDLRSAGSRACATRAPKPPKRSRTAPLETVA